MDSRERVITALNHTEPDRVPLDLWWSNETKARLLTHLNLSEADALQDYLGIDVRSVYPPYVGPPLRQYQDGSYTDFWGVVRTPVAHGGGGHYDEVLKPILGRATALKDAFQLPLPDPNWFDYENLRAQCQRYRNKAIVVGRMGRECQTLFIQLWYFRGLAQILEDLVAWPEFVQVLIDRIMDFRLEHLARILRVVRGRADILQLADDYGTQEGPFMDPKLWKRFFAPELRKMADMAHEAGLKVFLHCDGGIRPLIPDLIELGIDILNPVQPRCAGMDPEELKSDYGDSLCFHGAIDTQSVLPFGTRAAVEMEVKARFDVLGKGGGYILAPVHTVEPDVPLENLLTVYETARQYGRYG